MREESNKWWNSFSKMKRLTGFLKGVFTSLIQIMSILSRRNIVDGKNVVGHVSKEKLDVIYKEYLLSENDYFMDKRPPEPVSDEDGVEAPGDVDTDAGCVAKLRRLKHLFLTHLTPQMVKSNNLV